MTDEERQALRRLCPQFTDEELEQAHEALDEYLMLVWEAWEEQRYEQ